MRPLYILFGALVVVVLLVLIFVGVFRPRSGTIPTKAPLILSEHASEDIAVSYMLDGKVNANEEHRAIKITVTNQYRLFEIIGGYQGQVIASQTFANNTESFKAFLASLQTAGWLKENTKTTSPVYEGKCPLGYRYILKTSNLEDAPEMLWTTSCNSAKGTFDGSLSTIKKLFKAQIPDYTKLVRGTDLS